MHKSLFRLLAVFLLSGATAFAGSFTADFSNPNLTPGYNLNVQFDASGDPYPLVTNNQLILIYNEVSLPQSSIVINDLDGGAAIDSFTANFQMQIGPGSNPPADGVAFAFGPDILQQTTFGQEGPNMPSGGICVFSTPMTTARRTISALM